MKSLLTKEVISYQNFDMLASDILSLASEILPNQTLYINSLNDFTQVTLKVQKNDLNIHLEEGTTIPVEDAICNLIDYRSDAPLIIENLQSTSGLEKVKQTINDINAVSYLGIPITMKNGTRFGTLCAASSEAYHYDNKSVILLQKLAKMFSYYLELENLAYRDSLTGIYNRQHLYRFFDESPYEHGVVLMVDLDNFKSINDTFGHDVGNQILQEFASKLESFTNQTKYGYPVRLGGDEFVVVLPMCDQTDQIEHNMSRLLNLLSHWTTPIGEIKLTASIGVVIFNDDYHPTIRTLLKKADDALYEAKKLGKNAYHLIK
ncbi:GGDEF domain-containing protein [Acholeplasma manati]|uniref:GGDEF domain-containing protein n=1 Tax=Paracholeplasma manati TaxID=591373 RepID=A0ABT2Y3F8_9MOLU|nr:GGDEF domain-containing protein [Paracholeplasma manati]MCV2231271.1 GGDEF domain-containing protein [Paracholeplasma manati]